TGHHRSPPTASVPDQRGQAVAFTPRTRRGGTRPKLAERPSSGGGGPPPARPPFHGAAGRPEDEPGRAGGARGSSPNPDRGQAIEPATFNLLEAHFPSRCLIGDGLLEGGRRAELLKCRGEPWLNCLICVDPEQLVQGHPEGCREGGQCVEGGVGELSSL